MPIQFETLHVRSDDAPAVRAAVASAANSRKERVWRFRIATKAGWTSLYPELLYDPQEFCRTLSAQTGRLAVQVAGRDGLVWALHVAKAGKTAALFRSDAPTASDITAAVDALAPVLAGQSKGDRGGLADLLARRSADHSATYTRLCAMLGIAAPRMSFEDAPGLELVEFHLSQADPGPAPVKPPLPPIDYGAR